MKRHLLRGVSTFEFAFSLMVLVPLVLGTGAIGVALIRTMQTVQLARDVGHMYAKGVDMSDAGNKAIVGTLGSSLGLNVTTNSGRAVVILSALTYVDNNACVAGGTANGQCTNLNKWVFVQRIQMGNTSLRTSNYGSPLTSGPNGVTLDSQGKIDVIQYTTKSGAQAQFSSANGINPYTVVNNQVSGLPSGQRLYLVEAAAQGWAMPPFVNGSPTYSFAFF